MIGVFLRNKDNKICFVRPSAGVDITSLHYTPSAKMMIVTLKDGTEETITSEIAPEISDVFIPNAQVLVAQVNHAGAVEREYWAQLTVG